MSQANSKISSDIGLPFRRRISSPHRNERMGKPWRTRPKTGMVRLGIVDGKNAAKASE